MHLNGIFFEKFIFEYCWSQSHYVKPNETMAINKFQRSRLTINFSAKVARKVQLKWVFSDPPEPVGHEIEWGGLKFNDHRWFPPVRVGPPRSCYLSYFGRVVEQVKFSRVKWCHRSGIAGVPRWVWRRVRKGRSLTLTHLILKNYLIKIFLKLC